jgi:hypothetical protein
LGVGELLFESINGSFWEHCQEEITSVRRKKVPVRKMPAEQKYTLAFVMRLHKLPMLPQELLKEGFPSISRELFKAKRLGKVSR